MHLNACLNAPAQAHHRIGASFAGPLHTAFCIPKIACTTACCMTPGQHSRLAGMIEYSAASLFGRAEAMLVVAGSPDFNKTYAELEQCTVQLAVPRSPRARQRLAIRERMLEAKVLRFADDGTPAPCVKMLPLSSYGNGHSASMGPPSAQYAASPYVSTRLASLEFKSSQSSLAH